MTPQLNSSHVSARGFTLVEMLAIIGIMAVLMTAVAPALRGLANAKTVTTAGEQLELVLESARLHAITHQTYVRVALAHAGPGLSEVQGALLAISLASADGTLAADHAEGMADPDTWLLIQKPLALVGFELNPDLHPADPDAPPAACPFDSDIPEFTREVAGYGEVKFNGCVQFSPSGAASVIKGSVARFVQFPIDRTHGKSGENPVVLRLSGATGNVETLRVESVAVEG